MRDARGASDLMMNFLDIGEWEWGVGDGGTERQREGETEGRRDRENLRSNVSLSLRLSVSLSLRPSVSPSLPLSLPQFDNRRVFDVGDGAVIFAEQPQVDHDKFVATALVKIDHSPAQRQPLTVSRQSVMPRVARGMNPWAERDVAHQNLVSLRDPESRMADGIVDRRCLDDIVEELRHFALHVQVDFKRPERVAD